MRTDEELIELIRSAAQGLGKGTLSIKEFQRITGVQPSVVKKRFGSWNDAVRRAGLEPVAPRKKIRDDALNRLYLKCRHRPDESRRGEDHHSGALSLGRRCAHDVMLFEPCSESGVILLFGMMAGDLNFRVLKVDKGFPDMIAWRRLPQTERWQGLRVEFELRSRDYLVHLHPLPSSVGDCPRSPSEKFAQPTGPAERAQRAKSAVRRIPEARRADGFLRAAPRPPADLIICWEHNWPDCPIEVIELRGILERGKSGAPAPLTPRAARRRNSGTSRRTPPRATRSDPQEPCT